LDSNSTLATPPDISVPILRPPQPSPRPWKTCGQEQLRSRLFLAWMSVVGRPWARPTLSRPDLMQMQSSPAMMSLSSTSARRTETRSMPEPPTLLSHRYFSAVSPPDFAHFTPFFARSLRLGARKPETAKER